MTGESLTPEQAHELLELMSNGDGFDQGMDLVLPLLSLISHCKLVNLIGQRPSSHMPSIWQRKMRTRINSLGRC